MEQQGVDGPAKTKRLALRLIQGSSQPKALTGPELVAEECSALAERLMRRASLLPPGDAAVVAGLVCQLRALAGSSLAPTP